MKGYQLAILHKHQLRLRAMEQGEVNGTAWGEFPPDEPRAKREERPFHVEGTLPEYRPYKFPVSPTRQRELDAIEAFLAHATPIKAPRKGSLLARYQHKWNAIEEGRATKALVLKIA